VLRLVEVAMFSFFLQYGSLLRNFFVAFSGIFVLGATGFLGSGLRIFLSSPASFLWGDLSKDELKKFGFLGVVFAVLVGTYWALRPMKNALFHELVDMSYLPVAKMMSVVVFSAIIILYGKISDYFQRTKLFFVICSFFSLLFALSGFAYSYPSMSSYLHIPFIPGNILGWISYIAIESFGGISIAALFWGFVGSITKTNSAKKGFPLILLAGQVGSFSGATFVNKFIQVIGFSKTIYIISVVIMLAPVLVWFAMEAIPKELLLNDAKDDGSKNKKKAGLFEGIRLIFSHKYLMGVMVIATVYEVVGAIIDFQFQMLASKIYSTEALAAYNASFAQMNAFITLLLVLVGTGLFIRRLGVRLCLLGYPLMAGVAVALIFLKPTLGTFFVAMIAIKAFSYALNNPVKELLYLPTSHDVKFKAKGFIDALGQKAAKATGSTINASLIGGGLSNLLTYGSLISMGIIGVWIVVAIGLGHRYDKLIKDGEIIK
jgi:ATP:ADP antiporter, AAA family